jgi:hypothetical protein
MVSSYDTTLAASYPSIERVQDERDVAVIEDADGADGVIRDGSKKEGEPQQLRQEVDPSGGGCGTHRRNDGRGELRQRAIMG